MSDTESEESMDGFPVSPVSPAVPAKRFRNGRARLSTRLSFNGSSNNGSGNLNVSTISSGFGPLPKSTAPGPNKEQLKEIYSTCIDLFQAKKITVENAFSLKLIECLQDVIKSPEFDFSNLQLVGRTLEAGTKIYSCRVDYTHAMVMKLVAQLGAKGKNLERLRKELENQNATTEPLHDGDEEREDHPQGELGEDDGMPAKKTRQKKKKTCFTLPLEKLRMKFNENTKCYLTRKELVKVQFTQFIETRVYFDYPWVLGQVEAIQEARAKNKPEITEEEAERETHTFSRTYNEEAATGLKFLPYIQFPDESLYDKNLYDCWGRPKHGPGSAEEDRRLAMEARKAKLDELNAKRIEEEERARQEYAFDPEAPVDFEGLAEPDHDHGMDYGDDDGGGCMDGGTAGLEMNQKRYDLNTTLNDINSLEDLKNYYAALKEINADRYAAGGWGMGGLMKRGKGPPGPKGKRNKKEQQPFKFTEMNWKDPANRYQPCEPEKIEFDDRTIERWGWQTTNLPFVRYREVEEDEEDFMNAFMYPGQKQNDFMAEVLRYFNDPNRNILQQFGAKANKSEGEDGDGDGDWADLDDGLDMAGIEDMRNFRDFTDNGDNLPGSQSMHCADFEPGSGALNSFMKDFPASQPDFDFDEYEGMLGETGEGHGVKFARQPKPINMRILKLTIVEILCEKLNMDPGTKSPLQEDQTQTDFLYLIREIFQRVDERTKTHLTNSLLFVALLHVVVEWKLFMESTSTPTLENMVIICRGNAWIHKDHIPMPGVIKESDKPQPEANVVPKKNGRASIAITVSNTTSNAVSEDTMNSISEDTVIENEKTLVEAPADSAEADLSAPESVDLSDSLASDEMDIS